MLALSQQIEVGASHHFVHVSREGSEHFILDTAFECNRDDYRCGRVLVSASIAYQCIRESPTIIQLPKT